MNILKDSLIEDVSFAFLDVETTGLNPVNERICEIAIIVFKDSKEICSFNSLINPQKSISIDAKAVHKITEDMVKDKPIFSNIIPDILNILENTVIVGHNINFDLRFLQEEFKRSGFSFPDFLYLDTLKIARKFGNFSNNKLGNIAKSLEISNQNWHRAFSDVKMTEKIFEHFVIILKKEGISTLREILREGM